nr:ATP-binding cassette domain-containing protein [uncultured Dyadobacter sp.]
MIVVEHLSKHFNDIQAVDDISFTVKEGETMVLLGTSGCGKTTTLKMLNRLIDATSGQIHINGKDIFNEKPELIRRSIGYISQNSGLFPHYTVSENIAIVPKLLAWNTVDIRQRTEQLLARLRLPAATFGSKYPDELSGGQKQRVAIARALIADPPVLLMDEPFGALDPVTRADVRKAFADLPELKNKTIVLVTHDVQEALELGDRVCLMDRGRIIQQGLPGELLFRPVNDFVRTFFDQQRFMLELKTILLRREINALPNSKTTSKYYLTPDQNLWDALEAISTAGLADIDVKGTDGIVKKISVSDIYRIYNNVKKGS